MIPVYTTAEWRTIELNALELSSEDRTLVETLQDENKLRVDELRGSLRVQTFSWVGLVRFSEFELQITPKLSGEYAGLVAMLEYASDLEALRRLRISPVAFLEGDNNLLDLLALFFVEEVERIVRHGLLADYRQREDDLPVVRGRLLADVQILRRFGRVDRLECRFDEQLTNIAENQLVAAALGACRRRVRNPGVLRRVRRLSAVFESACSLDGVQLGVVRESLVYHRLNAVYHDAHALAWIILDALGIEDLYRKGDIRCFSFLLDMNVLFEAFISKWLRQILSGTALQVQLQRRDRSILWDAYRNAPYASVIPDLLIEHRGARMRLPVDAKYKRYDSRKLDNADVYQAFLYAFAYAGTEGAMPRALLIYPASAAGGVDIGLQVRHAEGSIGAEISALRIHIPTELTHVRSGCLSERALELRGYIVSSVSPSAVFGSGAQSEVALRSSD